VHYYKEGPLLNWGILLSVHSLNQALVWLKYRKVILDADKRRIRALQIQKERIAAQTEQLRKTLQKQKALIAEKKREERNLSVQKSKRQKLLRKIRNDKRIYAQKIKEYKEAEAAIKRLIRSKEAARTSSISRRTEVSHFAELKGKLPWPTSGRILHHYGKIRNKKLHTVQENIGVDIKAPFGTPVRSAADGVVTAITWQRGRGNILIIDHYGGYYTVYAHLAEILVVPGQKVKQGEEIGKVGNSGSLSGSMLHFEIWKNTKIMNPERWLRKRRG
jgi:murein DD-endopeptidase MepM/ murein hydrolase activator NlpD